jgi:hypothetical protein
LILAEALRKKVAERQASQNRHDNRASTPCIQISEGFGNASLHLALFGEQAIRETPDFGSGRLKDEVRL